MTSFLGTLAAQNSNLKDTGSGRSIAVNPPEQERKFVIKKGFCDIMERKIRVPFSLSLLAFKIYIALTFKIVLLYSF